MTTWHGYEQHPDAHPERPWWRAYVTPLTGVRGWTRYAWDGTSPVLNDPDPMPEDQEDYLAYVSTGIAAMDWHHPVPAPPPRCGQVWVWPIRDGAGGGHRLVTGVDPDGVAYTSGLVISEHKTWPPPGAVLVAGPGAPWAPTEAA